MKILYIGDITGKLGRKTVKDVLPVVMEKEKPDFVIAQGENVTHGKGLRLDHYEELKALGINFFTGGNHSLYEPEIFHNEKLDAIRPANMVDAPGRGWKIADSPFGKILIISLLGQTVGHQLETTNPIEMVDEILKETQGEDVVARILNFHGDYSSEKVVIGHYLDGRMSAVLGDHWHVPTADAQVMPAGTAHITDVGMVGSLDSSLGVPSEIIIDRWKTGVARRNEMEENGRRQFNAVIINIDNKTGLAKSIKQIREILA